MFIEGETIISRYLVYLYIINKCRDESIGFAENIQINKFVQTDYQYEFVDIISMETVKRDRQYYIIIYILEI